MLNQSASQLACQLQVCSVAMCLHEHPLVHKCTVAYSVTLSVIMGGDHLQDNPLGALGVQKLLTAVHQGA